MLRDSIQVGNSSHSLNVASLCVLKGPEVVSRSVGDKIEERRRWLTVAVTAMLIPARSLLLLLFFFFSSSTPLLLTSQQAEDAKGRQVKFKVEVEVAHR